MILAIKCSHQTWSHCQFLVFLSPCLLSFVFEIFPILFLVTPSRINSSLENDVMRQKMAVHFRNRRKIASFTIFLQNSSLGTFLQVLFKFISDSFQFYLSLPELLCLQHKFIFKPLEIEFSALWQQAGRNSRVTLSILSWPLTLMDLLSVMDRRRTGGSD